MASIGESGCCGGGQPVDSGKACTEEVGLQSIQTPCPGDTENIKSSWPQQGSGHHLSHLILLSFSQTSEGKRFLIFSVAVKGILVVGVC